MKAKDLLISKSKVTTIYNDITIEEGVKILLKSNLSCVPVLERGSNRYLYSISAYGLLRKVALGNKEEVYKESITKVDVERLLVPCSINTEIKHLVYLVANQNFVPVVDEKGIFEGIVTRKVVINYLIDQVDKTEE